MSKNKNFSVINYDDLQSKTMDWLRFPLMVAVCFIHVPHKFLISLHPSVFAHGVYFLITQVLARIAVPLFFIISGYYFFYTKNSNECVFNKQIYISKIKKRIRTLLIPFLIWNTLTFCYHYAGAIYHFQIKTVLYNFIHCFSLIPGGGMPVAFQFWFIRDLLYMVLISPILYYILKKGKLVTLIILFIVWFSPLKVMGLPKVALFFFSLGAFFSINGLNIIKEIAKLPKITVYLVTVILIIADLIINAPSATVAHAAVNNIYLHNIFILFGIVSILNIVSSLIQQRKIKSVNKTLANASFFLFAIHPIPLSNILVKLPLNHLPHNDFTFLVVYLCSVPLMAAIAVYLYKFLKHYMPELTAVITGGR